MSDPRTEAGRRVWDEITDSIENGGGLHVSVADILAIEAEARSEPDEGLREAAQALLDEIDANESNVMADHYRRQAVERLRTALADKEPTAREPDIEYWRRITEEADRRNAQSKEPKP